MNYFQYFFFIEYVVFPARRGAVGDTGLGIDILPGGEWQIALMGGWDHFTRHEL